MNLLQSFAIPERIWIEMHDPMDACDVIIEMEDGAYYTAMFVTLPHLERQMDLSYQIGKNLPDMPAARYAAFETPHILVPDLSRDTIEDTIDNLLALDTFYTLFTLVTDDKDHDTFDLTFIAPVGMSGGKRATSEVAAVVVTEVLRCTDSTVA
ncbi:MAG: hypothetical protein SGI73_20855 [Chloroflexota bacterium]|nr:hypothetical protein [Chloroflexota bacterium]